MNVVKNDIFFLRCSLCIFLAAVWIGCGGAKEAVRTQSQPDARQTEKEPEITIPEDPHRLLPASCFGALSIDVDAVSASPIFQSYLEEISIDLNQAEKHIVRYIVEHTDRLVIGLVLRSKKSNKKPYSIVIGRGDFDMPRFLSLVKEFAATNQSSGVTHAGDAETRKGRFPVFFDDGEIQGLVLDSHTIMIADNKLIPDVLDLLVDHDLPRFIDSDLYKRITPHVTLGQGGLSFVSSAPNPVKKKFMRQKKTDNIFAKYERALESIQAGGMRLDLNAEINAKIVLETASPDHPQTIIGMINGLLFVGRIAIDDPVFNQVANQLSTDVNGLFVNLKIHATREQLSRLIEIANKRSGD
ncbi:MAG: hypothetical protein JXA30_13490 [Deltaproteobacteria bacterium]|nr:hypothetical protein [Deltaproteobacteria bacterium]